MASDVKKPPKYLRRPGRDLWRAVLRSFDLPDPHDLARLAAACEARDRCAEARAVLDESGLIYTDRFDQPKPRPEVAIERDSRMAMLRALRELGLDSAELIESRRPPLKMWA